MKSKTTSIFNANSFFKSKIKFLSTAFISATLTLPISHHALAASDSFDNDNIIQSHFFNDQVPQPILDEFNNVIQNTLEAVDQEFLDLITNSFFSDDFLSEPGGEYVKNIMGQLPLFTLFSSVFIDSFDLGTGGGPSAEELMLQAIAQLIQESETRIIDVINQANSDEATSAANGLFDWFELYSSSSIWSQNPDILEEFSIDISQVRSALETAGGDTAIRNLQFYMLVAALELHVHQRINRGYYLNTHEEASPSETLLDFQPVLKNIIENVEDYVIYGSAGQRETWQKEFGYNGTTTVFSSVYQSHLEPVLEVIDDWRKLANLPHREFADVEFYRAKTRRYSGRNSTVNSYTIEDGVMRVDMTPFTWEPLSKDYFYGKAKINYDDGTSEVRYFYSGRHNAFGEFSARWEVSVSKSANIEFSTYKVCGKMMYEHTTQCRNLESQDSIANKLKIRAIIKD